MTEEDRSKENVVAIKARESKNRNWAKNAHHGAADELIEDAIDMLSLLEMLGDAYQSRQPDKEPVVIPCRAVAVQASQIVKVLRKAQEHHREALP